jgi:biotin carboxylase
MKADTMRILFIDDDGMETLAPYVTSLGHVPVVLRTGVYDAWHADECAGMAIEVHRLDPGASATQLIDAASALQPDAVVSLALLDPQCVRDALVGDYFRQAGLPVLANSPATVALANDKFRTKRLLFEHGIGVTLGEPVGDLAQARAAAERLGYPLILKRNDGYSGIGMRLCESDEQLQRYYRRAPGPMLMEQFTAGIELSVDVLRWGGVTQAVAVIHKECTSEDLRRHPIYRVRIAPAPLTAAQLRQVKAVAEQAMDLLGTVGLAECEMILHPSRGALVLEINPRIAGTARLSAAASGIDLHKCLVDMVLGRFDPARLHRPPAVALQLPMASPLDDANRAFLEKIAAVRFIKPINWAPDLGLHASLTVAESTCERVLDVISQLQQRLTLQLNFGELSHLLTSHHSGS